MAEVSRDTFKTDTTVLYPDNVTAEISPADLRAQMDNIADSTVFKVTGKTAAPTVNDDAAGTGGNGTFEPGDIWVDETNEDVYICADNTATAAVWTKIESSVISTVGAPVNNQIAVFADATTLEGSVDFVFDDSTNRLGIGTTSPANTIHLRDAFPAIRFDDTDTAGVHSIVSNGAALQYSVDPGNADANSFHQWTIDNIEEMRLTPTGLGIGRAPATPLDVETTGLGVRVVNSTGANAWLRFDNNTASTPYVGQLGGSMVMGVNDNNPIRFVTNNAERMRIGGTGRVGINTPSADINRTFEVTGIGTEQIVAHFKSGSDVRAWLTLADTETTGDSQVGIAANGNRLELIADSTISAVLSDGKFAINTTALPPAVTLDIDGTDAVKITSGTTAQRPGTPAAGMVRHNTTTGRYEVYDAAWRGIVVDNPLETFYNEADVLNPAAGNDIVQFDPIELVIPANESRFITFDPFNGNDPFLLTMTNATIWGDNYESARDTIPIDSELRLQQFNFIQVRFGTKVPAGGGGHVSRWTSNFYGDNIVINGAFVYSRLDFAEIDGLLNIVAPAAEFAYFVHGYVSDIDRYFFGIRNEHTTLDVKFNFNAQVNYSSIV